MQISIVFLTILVAILGLSYGPFLWHRCRVKMTERTLDEQIASLDGVYNQCRVVVTDKLGEGGSKNIGPDFADVQKNQDFATASIMNLMGRATPDNAGFRNGTVSACSTMHQMKILRNGQKHWIY